MRLLLLHTGFINGSYMLIDGLHVLISGKYIGPGKPGPWAMIVEKMNINVFKLGPLFIIFGLLWLGWVVSFATHQPYAILYGILISILTLWYLPIGSLLSLFVLLVILLNYL